MPSYLRIFKEEQGYGDAHNPSAKLEPFSDLGVRSDVCLGDSGLANDRTRNAQITERSMELSDKHAEL